MRQLLLLLVTAMLTGCGQSQPAGSKAASASPTSAVGQRINIPGTRLFVVPPTGFQVSTSFAGLARGEDAMLNVIDLDGGNYYRNAADFSRQGFERQGVQVYDYRDTTISGYPAKYAHLQGSDGMRAHELVFGDSTFSTMLTGMYQEQDSATGRQLKSALLTSTYDKRLVVNPFARAGFTLTDKSRFRFFKLTGNMYIYTVGAVETPANSQEPVLTVTPLPADGPTPADMAQEILASLARNGFTDVQVTASSHAPVNGYEAYEATVSLVIKGKKAAFYELFVSNGTRMFQVQGALQVPSAAALAEVQAFAHTIHIK